MVLILYFYVKGQDMNKLNIEVYYVSYKHYTSLEVPPGPQ